ncbi:MAG TPA: hypothetical protein GXZ24_06235 [Firmicutes bacterium]|jgi:uncharacterized membrane protein YagU involved in acid resistance|nr:hypothetical protein [Bacillota bacterium]
MTDRVTQGFIAGFLGAIVAVAVTFGARALGFNTILWADFMSVFIMGKKADGALELVIFVAVQFVFLGFLGVIFSMLLPRIKSKYILFKGALYGVVIWFILFSLPHLLRLPFFKEVPLKTVLTHGIGAFLWGLGTAFILNKISMRVAQ